MFCIRAPPNVHLSCQLRFHFAAHRVRILHGVENVVASLLLFASLRVTCCSLVAPIKTMTYLVLLSYYTFSTVTFRSVCARSIAHW